MKEIDIRGLFCPLPLTYVSKELKSIPVGERLRVIVDNEAFEKEIKIWALETGNRLVEFKKDGQNYIAVIERGKGFHGNDFLEKVKFISIGIKLHIVQYLLKLTKREPKYLITFVSIPEGFRADRWLKEQNITDYTVLPVPDEIYPYCGLVLGVKNKERALEIFSILRDNRFLVEDVYQKDKGTYKSLELEQR
ncbi:MAG: DUF3343 domain-containing protein [Aquificae bacterium]|nr:DUF3343 domain-containing protein [Aquificota bacterium]